MLDYIVICVHKHLYDPFFFNSSLTTVKLNKYKFLWGKKQNKNKNTFKK